MGDWILHHCKKKKKTWAIASKITIGSRSCFTSDHLLPHRLVRADNDIRPLRNYLTSRNIQSESIKGRARLLQGWLKATFSWSAFLFIDPHLCIYGSENRGSIFELKTDIVDVDILMVAVHSTYVGLFNNPVPISVSTAVSMPLPQVATGSICDKHAAR